MILKKNLSFCTKLVQELHLSIKKRLNQSNIKENDSFNDTIYFLSTILDLSFKFFWLRDLNLTLNAENRLKQNIIRLLLNEINKDSIESLTKLSNINSSSTPRLKKKKLFSYDDTSNYHGNDTTTMSRIAEVEVYLTNPIQSQFSPYWRHSQLHRLKKLVTCVFVLSKLRLNKNERTIIQRFSFFESKSSFFMK